ncbi:MAG: hypothetical protein IKJ26_07675 [Clostridia bacterium]|nr:hypothetical protein [Clostridia bacterium]
MRILSTHVSIEKRKELLSNIIRLIVTLFASACCIELAQECKFDINKYYGLLIVIPVIFSAWMFSFGKKNAPIRLSSLMVALLLTFWGLVGMSLDNTEMECFFFSKAEPMRVIMYASLCLLVSTFIESLYECFEKLECKTDSEQHAENEKKRFAIAFVLIILSWLPFIIADYPGSVCYDTLKQLKQFNGKGALNASNPLMVTMIFGSLFNVGRIIASDNLGIFLNVMFQTILCAFAMARTCKWIRRLSGSRIQYYISLIFFMIVPTWGSAAQSVLKDVVHLGFFLLYFVSYIKLLCYRRLTNTDFIWFVVHALLAIYSRKAAFAIVAISTIILVLYKIKEKRYLSQMLIAFAFILVAHYSIDGLIYANPRIAKPMERENYSLPFQMTARYCKTYGNEMSKEEIAVIDSVLDFDTIVEKYDPSISDAVKVTFHSTSSEMHEFWKQFIKMGVKHPQAYVKHLIAGTYKYTYPLTPGTGSYRRYIQKDEEFYNAYYTNKQMHSNLAKYFEKWEKTVGLELFIGPGMYVWIIVILLGYAFRNKQLKSIVGIMPVCILLVGLFFTHVNGENRYAFPLIASVPMCYVIVVNKKLYKYDTVE